MKKSFFSVVLKRSSTHLFFGLLCVVLFTGVSCLKQEEIPPPKPVTLTVWRTADTENDFDAAVAAYTAQYPYVDFEFRIFRPDEYEQALFDAWARGEGPDIFSVPQYRLGRFRDVIAPMPPEVTLKTVRTEKSSLGGNKTIVEESTVPQLAADQIPNLFVGPVADDVVYEDQLYGLPLSMDTLVMYYNRDILARAQIAVPPTTWEEFVNALAAPGMIAINEDREIVQAGAALGTTKTTPYFFDILSVLMMQNGVAMTEEGRVAFASTNFIGQAIAALSFYTSFSDPTKATYTWNDDGLDGLESFIGGSSAIYFGYYRDKEKIEQRGSALNFSWTAIPQVNTETPVNYATYPVETVHIQSPDAAHAWNFLRFAATSEEELVAYLDSTDRIPALRTIVAQKQNDSEKGIFMQQSFTARSWYHGVSPDDAIAAMGTLIESARSKNASLEDSMKIAEKAIALTLEKKE